MAYQQVQFTNLTQAQYDALVQKNPGMLYFTSDTGRIYKGDVSYSQDVSSKIDVQDDFPLVSLAPQDGVATLQDRAVNNLVVQTTTGQVSTWVWSDGQSRGSPVYNDNENMWQYTSTDPSFYVAYVGVDYESSGEDEDADKIGVTLVPNNQLQATVASLNQQQGSATLDVDGTQVSATYWTNENGDGISFNMDGVEWYYEPLDGNHLQVGDVVSLDGQLSVVATKTTALGSISNTTSLAFPNRNPSTRARRMLLKISVPPDASTDVEWPSGFTYITPGGGNTPPTLSPSSSMLLDI